MTDDDDTARELINSADMPHVLSEEEAVNAYRWTSALASHIVSGHRAIRADNDEVRQQLVNQVADIDAIVRRYMYHGADRTIQPGEDDSAGVSWTEMADIVVRSWLEVLDP